jgi:hypothetical protein
VTTYVIRNGRLVDKSKISPRRPDGKTVHVIRDEMESTWHPGNGRRYTSKAKFRMATRDAGCVEVGNDPAINARPRAPTAFSPQVRRQEIRESIRRQLHGGRA